jgi:hypothetical protein
MFRFRFAAHLDQSEVTAVVVNGDTLQFTLAAGQTQQTVMPANYVTANPTFVPTLAKSHVRIDVRSAAEPAVSYSSVFVGISLLAVLCFTVYRVTGGRSLAHRSQDAGSGPGGIARYVARRRRRRRSQGRGEGDRRFPSRAGAVRRRSAAAFPKACSSVARRNRQDAARAFHRRRGAVPFLFASGSDFVEIYAGVGAKRIRKLFKDARRHPPASFSSTSWTRSAAAAAAARSATRNASRRSISCSLKWTVLAHQGHRRGRRHEPSGHSRSGAAARPAASIVR